MPNVLSRSGSGYAQTIGTGASCVLATDSDVDMMWKPTGVKITWQSSATAGNRQVKLTIADAAASTIADLILVTTLAANLVGIYSWYVGAPVTGTSLSVGTSRYSTFPLADMILPPGSTLTASDIAAVDGDDIVTLNLLYNTMEPVPQ